MNMRNIKEFTLLVNDKEVSCKDFVGEMVGNGLLGMITSLDLENPKVNEISIKIKYFE